MTVVQSLRKRSSFLLLSAVSFIVVLTATRLMSNEALVQPQSDLGIVLGLALAAGFLVVNDLRAQPFLSETIDKGADALRDERPSATKTGSH